jgi:putative ABC transport system permease protein
LFTIGVTAISGLLFGTAPAWQATKLDLNEVLKTGGRTSHGTRRNALRLLVIAEFSLALTLLASGGMALKGFWVIVSRRQIRSEFITGRCSNESRMCLA